MTASWMDINKPPSPATAVTAAQVANGPIFPPQQRLLTYSPDEWEGFVEEWAYYCPRFYVSTSKSIIKALINMHSFEIQLSPIG